MFAVAEAVLLLRVEQGLLRDQTEQVATVLHLQFLAVALLMLAVVEVEPQIPLQLMPLCRAVLVAAVIAVVPAVSRAVLQPLILAVAVVVVQIQGQLLEMAVLAAQGL